MLGFRSALLLDKHHAFYVACPGVHCQCFLRMLVWFVCFVWTKLSFHMMQLRKNSRWLDHSFMALYWVGTIMASYWVGTSLLWTQHSSYSYYSVQGLIELKLNQQLSASFPKLLKAFQGYVDHIVCGWNWHSEHFCLSCLELSGEHCVMHHATNIFVWAESEQQSWCNDPKSVSVSRLISHTHHM